MITALRNCILNVTESVSQLVISIADAMIGLGSDKNRKAIIQNWTLQNSWYLKHACEMLTYSCNVSQVESIVEVSTSSRPGLKWWRGIGWNLGLLSSTVVNSEIIDLLNFQQKYVFKLATEIDNIVSFGTVCLFWYGKISWLQKNPPGINSIPDSSKKSGQRLVGDVDYDEVQFPQHWKHFCFCHIDCHKEQKLNKFFKFITFADMRANCQQKREKLFRLPTSLVIWLPCLAGWDRWPLQCWCTTLSRWAFLYSRIQKKNKYKYNK